MTCLTQITARNSQGALIHFAAECRCWKCESCRAKLQAKHAARAKVLFQSAVFHLAVPNDAWEATYTRVRREVDGQGQRQAGPSYMRVIVGGESHVFFSRKVCGSTRYAPANAAEYAKTLIYRVSNGGRHVTYSVGWQESVGESIKRYTLAAVGIPRKVFEAVVEAAKVPIKYIERMAFAPTEPEQADDLVGRMKCRRSSHRGILSCVTNADMAYMMGVTDSPLSG